MSIGSVAAFAQDAEDEDDSIFELSPFTVTSSEDTGYRATNTLAGTRLRTDLKDIGSAISVITEQFLQDTGATDNESLLVYTTNTETGGVQGNYTGLGNGETLDEGSALLRPNRNNRVRGLNSADNTRNFFLTDIPWDNYNVNRVDLQRGPNSILFGLGSPAGIINATLDEASFKDSGEVQFRFGSWGTTRGSFNVNREILEGELGVRIAALSKNQKYQQDPSFEEDQRLYVAAKYTPKFLKSDSMETTLTANFERGEIESNRPRTLPPEDRLSPWFERLGKATYNPLEAYNPNEAIPGSGAVQVGTDSYEPSIGQLFAGHQIRFANPDSSEQQGIIRVAEPGWTDGLGIGPDGLPDGDVQFDPFWRSVAIANYPQYAQNEGLEFANTLAPFKRQSLTDRSIFDFKNHLIDGPNKREWRDFDAVSFKLGQTFLNNKVGFELAYDKQDYSDRTFKPLEGSPAITVDINSHLPPNLDANPNAGRPYVFSRAKFGNISRQTAREVKQATAYADINTQDFMNDSWMSKFLGRHIFTAFGASQEIEQSDQTFSAYMLDPEFSRWQGRENFDIAENEIGFMSYLGGSLLDVNSVSDVSLQPITAVQKPTATSLLIFDSTWNATGVDPADSWTRAWDGEVLTQSENPDNYVGWREYATQIISGETAEGARLSTRLANKQLDTIDSHAFIWQGFLWDGAIVPTYGYRKDESDTYSVNLQSGTTYLDLTDGSYVVPTTPDNSVAGTSESWSVVVHADQFLPELPLGTRLSLFYNESSNFQPIAGRIDQFAKPLGAVSGETEDYGFTVSTFDGKVNFKVNWYETTVRDASFDPGNMWFVGAAEARALRSAKRYEANLNGEPGSGGWWYRPRNGQTAEEALEEQRLHVDAVLGNLPSDEFFEAWGMDPENGWTQNWWLGGAQPVGLVSTADTMSEGVEFELNVEPNDQWSIMANASKQTAQNVNIAGSLKEWVEARNEHWNGPAGDIRMWWGGGSSSVLQQWNSTFYSRYLLALQQEGTNVPEMRPWRFNLITSYRFKEGGLKGFNVGGSLRWEDKVAIGYPVFTDTDGQDKFDIDNPYWGPSRENVDMWLGYSKQLKDGKKWRVQLNVRNVFADDELIPITVQGDGSPGAFRIPNSREWTVSNTLTF